MKKFRLFAIVMLLPLLGVAQNITVKGKLKDAKSGEVIPFANVALCRTTDTLFMRGATTDFDGIFSIKDVAAKKYLLTITYVGYEKIIRPVEVKGNLDLGTIELKPGSIMLDAVQIVAEKPVFSMDGEKNIYNTSDDPSIQTGTASDALQNAPGIEIDADGNITLRGTQSVDVWINDRPSHMDGEALKQYIKMLPANGIERIEVISNPSARYGGGTPVVNIITTQKVQRNEFVSLGLNGTTRPDQGIWMSEMKPWVSYVFANEKFNFNIYANFGYDRSNSEYTGSSVMLDENGDTSRIDNYRSTSDRKAIESYIGGHLNYTVDDKNSMGAWYGAYPRWGSNYEWGRSERIELLTNAGNYTYEGTESTPMVAKPNGGGYFGGWYEHKFDKETGHKLNINVNGNGYSSRAYTHHDRFYEFFPENNIDREVDNLWKNFNMSLQADYTLPFGKQDTVTKRFANELQAGLGYNRENSRAWSLSQWTAMGYLAGRTDRMNSDNQQHNDNFSAYATYQRRLGNLTAKLGLRGNMDSQHLIYYDAPEYSMDSTFFNLTPSLHLSYATKSMHNFSFSYTRRITQPGLTQLTLYQEYQFDNFGNWGNPGLHPTYNQKIELQWDKYFMKFGSVGAQLYYSGNTDQISNLSNVTYSTFYGHVVSYTMPMNIGNSWSTGLDLNITYRPSAFLNIRFNGSLRYDNEDFEFNDRDFKNSNWSYKFRINAWAKLWKNYQFFVNAHYGSPTKSIFTITDARKGVDVGMNADFFDRKMTVNLNIHDIFNINVWHTENTNPFYNSVSNWKPMSRYITLGITFRFGKMELAGMAQENGSGNTESGPGGML